MSLFEFKLPDIGEGVMEGEIVAWHVEPGESVKEDQPMVEVMTDKATVTIGAPKTGRITGLMASVGEVVEVGAVIVALDLNGTSVAAPAVPSAEKVVPAPVAPVVAAPSEPASITTVEDEGPAATAVGDIKETLPGASMLSSSEPTPTPIAAVEPVSRSEYYSERPLATPATRKMARDLSVDLKRVPPTGNGGRVTKGDVESYHQALTSAALKSKADAVVQPRKGKASARAASNAAPIAVNASADQIDREERKPFVGIRRKIAERMQQSTNTAAHFTFVEECDVARLKELRARLRPAADEAGVKLTFLPFIVKAVVAALRKHPVLNSALDETTNELVYRRYYNIGIAASTDQGLMVPVVKDADRKTILEIAGEIARLGHAAKEGQISSSDLTGSTFTITSLGRQGGLFATPVLNFPEVGILGIHQIKKKPVVRNDQIEIGEIMLLSLSFDHRIVDGHVGAAFAYDIIAYLEEPERLFLEMT